MKLRLKNNEYFEIYFKANQAYIVFGHLFYDVHHGFSQIYKDSLQTESIKSMLKGLDPKCGAYVKDVHKYMTENQYYFAVYKLDDQDVTYSIKDEQSNKIIATEASMLMLIENNILKENQTKEL